ncbi:hypothetical protein O9993_01665 [Vibrio lentus]|nr:hypothetical protein [Vibrio lentus]
MDDDVRFRGDYTGIDIYEESKANMPTPRMENGDTVCLGIKVTPFRWYWTRRLLDSDTDAKIAATLCGRLMGAVTAPHPIPSRLDHSVG